MKKYLLTCLLLTLPFGWLFAQKTAKVQEYLVGKRFALHYYTVEHFLSPNEQPKKGFQVRDIAGKRVATDTLVNAYDCGEEYLEMLANNTYTFPSLEKQPSKWAIETDSTILFYKANGKLLMRATITLISKDSLVLKDYKNSKVHFTMAFKYCTQADLEYVEQNSQIFSVWRGQGIIAGIQAWENNTLAEIGYSRLMQVEWSKRIFAMSANAEIGLNTSMHGLGVNFWSEDKIFAYGAGVNLHTDFQKAYFGFKPTVGFSFNRLFNSATYTAHLLYSYNFIFTKDQVPALNLHAVTFRINLPFKRKVEQVVRYTNQEYND